jgi:hypothetical protein
MRLTQSVSIYNCPVQDSISTAFYSRQQEEREIRHKLKKGEIDDLPRDVLDTFPSLLSVPAKGIVQ